MREAFAIALPVKRKSVSMKAVALPLLAVVLTVSSTAGLGAAQEREVTGPASQETTTIKDRLEADPLWWVLVFLAAGASAGWGAAWWFFRREQPKSDGDMAGQDSHPFGRTKLDEDQWLISVVTYLRDCQTATAYLRYYREPDYAGDDRLENKRQRIREIMTQFADLLVNHSDRVRIVAFRKKLWTDDPNSWLVKRIIATGRSRSDAVALVNNRVSIINEEPIPNSSTIYLLDNRYLFYNRVAGELGSEVKTYHAQDLSNSVLPTLIARGLAGIARGAEAADA